MLTDNSDLLDEQLVEMATNGDLSALDQLIRRHQAFIYNVALRYALSPQDAQDLSQEALVKIVTRIGQFAGKSSFRTWAYRIVVNTFLDAEKTPLEGEITSFEQYGEALDSMLLQPLQLPADTEPDAGLIVEEAKLGCMLGMLLCLDRKQRLVFILGDLFGVPSAVGAEVFGVPADTYRKRLQRARRDLRNFMNAKCGLINKANPCRCRAKTTAFIAAGWVDPQQLKFTRPTLRTVAQRAKAAVGPVDTLLADDYVELYRQHPYYDGPDWAVRFRKLVADERVREVFDL
ncbi:RNA polymerase sigma factor [Lewinella sp. 4G2]|uniref:RNA polymerase sigma factor n=1 Tax=Lewinella sp. 4G2 TaxID=1803372 RepID=UPI0007B4AD59|nr:RNA polymerase sigma factor [Lewinella sp. 4G2]OAV45195.1 hypothetical protein A3850_012135 [Lewinella sp. 4G2]